MKRVKRKETIGNGRQYFTRSKKRQEEAAADEKDLISSLPLDLKLQILAKLPPKSIAKFISVSKLWSSIVRGKDLTELFISRSSTRPCFLFILRGRNIVEFHSYSQEEPVSRHHRHVKSITPKTICSHLRSPIRGLICGQEIDKNVSKVICNPSTGQCVTLPRVKARIRRPIDDILHFLGYDPVNDQYKVLCMITRSQGVPRSPRPVISKKHQVFTLGAIERAWRIIECKHPHFPATKELCRDGVVYYGAWYNSHHEGSLIVSFDVRSEDFGVIKLPEGVIIQGYWQNELVNYHGNIALVQHSNTGSFDLWVLQDVKKQEWSKISILLPVCNVLYCRGTIGTGEIIFAPSQYEHPFFLLYYDLKRNNVKRVDIEGVRENGSDPIMVFLDHVESPMFL